MEDDTDMTFEGLPMGTSKRPSGEHWLFIETKMGIEHTGVRHLIIEEKLPMKSQKDTWHLRFWRWIRNILNYGKHI